MTDQASSKSEQKSAEPFWWIKVGDLWQVKQMYKDFWWKENSVRLHAGTKILIVNKHGALGASVVAFMPSSVTMKGIIKFDYGYDVKWVNWFDKVSEVDSK